MCVFPVCSGLWAPLQTGNFAYRVLKCGPVLLAAALLTSGCAHYPANAPLASAAVNTEAGYRFKNASSPTNSPELLLMLAFSGGGTRAAALSYGVLEQLAHTKVDEAGTPHRLLDEVDAISSVSGGSFTAAYYALNGERIFTDFESQFLKKHVQNGLLCRTLYPWNRFRLLSSTFNASDLAAEYYDQLLFKGATFGDLAARKDRPFILINATDMALGERFEFTQGQFDLIHSDLSRYPISRAVAASSAFPVVLSPIVLRNYSDPQVMMEPEWIQRALSDPGTSDRQRNLARSARSYLDGQKRRYVHLLDGGIVDNLGLQSSIDRIIALNNVSTVMRGKDIEKIRRIAIVIVDAETEREYGWDTQERPPKLRNLVSAIEGMSINHHSSETLEAFRKSTQAFTQELEAARRKMGVESPANLTLYTVELHFNALTDAADRRFFNSVPTKLQLPSESVDRLRRMAAVELSANKEFRRLLDDLSRDGQAAGK
jgi:NTE family protein